MRDPERLLEGDPSDFGVQLLREWDSEQPAAGAFTKTAAALGLGTAVATAPTTAAATVATSAATSGAGAASASAFGTTATTASAVTKAAVLKWLAGGLVAGTMVSATVLEVARLDADPAPEPSTAAATPAAPKRPSPSATRTSNGVSSAQSMRRTAPAVASAADVSPGHPPLAAFGLAPVAASATPPPRDGLDSDASTLPREVAAIEDARRAVRSGNAEAALSALARYRALGPSGALAPEATLVEIDALRLAGRTAQAAALAQVYVSHYPKSPQAGRLRRLLTEESAPTGSGRQ